MNKTTFATVAIAVTILVGCVPYEDVPRGSVPIRMVTSVTPATRAIANPTQESQLSSGEKVYIWANHEASAGVSDWTQGAYLKAWTLTADGSGALAGSEQYYGEGTLSMVAIHGNFSFTEGIDAFPGTVVHSVATDQHAAGGYERSDLMWWSTAGQGASVGAIPVTFSRKLSKIEITLVSGDYSEDELDHASVTLQNVLPDVALNLSDGSIGTAYGVPVTITPRKTGKVNYEAILPPQQKPLDFIRVELGGTVVRVDAQVEELDANTRYPYDLTLERKDVRKNPLWYVAEYNVNYDGASTYSWASTLDEGYFFSWSDAITAAEQFDGWHLPTEQEWNSIVPGRDASHAAVNLWSISSGTTYSNTTYLSFGYNDATFGKNGYMTEKSYWYHHDDNTVYAIRYCDSPYCSAWKYERRLNGQSAANPIICVVSSTLLGESLSTSQAASRFGTTAANWEAVYFGNNEAAGAVQRMFAARGEASASGPIATNRAGQVGFFWSSTRHPGSDSYRFHLSLSSSGMGLGGSAEMTCSSVRLFHTNRDPYWGVKIGDIILSDGTYATTSTIAARLAADNTLKPVAIVFAVTTGTNAIRMPEYDINKYKNGKGNYFHGYAMALKKSSGSSNGWCANVGGLQTQLITRSTPTTLSSLADVKADYKGFEYCANAKAYCAANGIAVSNLYAIRIAETYSTAEAPSNTSGWFLPSVGQIYLELKGFYSSVITGAETWNTDTSGTHPTYTRTGTPAHVNAMNTFIQGKMGTTLYNTYFQPIAQADYYHTSTEAVATYAYYVAFNAETDNDNKVKLSAAYAKSGGFSGVARPVLAF